MDIYYRLDVVELAIPLLRSHREDFPALAREGTLRGAEFSAKPSAENAENFRVAFVNIFGPGEMFPRVLHRAPGSESD